MANINIVQRNVENLLKTIRDLLIKLSEESIQQGFFLPVESLDADAPNNSIYFSTDSSKLVYKDSLGSTHDLY